MIDIQQNSLMAWLLASRPKTLAGAAVPVMMAGGMALYDSVTSQTDTFFPKFWIWLICLLFAFLMQIDANFINDYFDFKKGADDEHRLGPRRTCAQGWITTFAMKRAILITTIVACVVGLPLLVVGGWQMLLIGACCVLFCFLYTTHLSYLGLGDVLVLVFFGIVPVCITYYLIMSNIPYHVFMTSLSCGMIIDTLLVVNNYRDRDGDRIAGKKTLAVRLGEKPTRYLYFLLGLVGCHFGILYLGRGQFFTSLLPFSYLFLHMRSYHRMSEIKKGKMLNQILGETARNIFLFGLLFVTGILIDTLIAIR